MRQAPDIGFNRPAFVKLVALRIYPVWDIPRAMTIRIWYAAETKPEL